MLAAPEAAAPPLDGDTRSVLLCPQPGLWCLPRAVTKGPGHSQPPFRCPSLSAPAHPPASIESPLFDVP